MPIEIINFFADLQKSIRYVIANIAQQRGPNMRNRYKNGISFDNRPVSLIKCLNQERKRTACYLAVNFIDFGHFGLRVEFPTVTRLS